jgi:hypothetical protein
MFLIVGKKSDGKIIYRQGISDISISDFKAAYANTAGGSSNDYSVLQIDNTTWERLNRGDEYEPVWENEELTGVDFSIENNRKLFTIRTVDPDNNSVVKDTMIGDGIDSIIIQVKTCFPDETLDASVNATALIPVIVPDERIIYLKATITNGVAADIVFKTKLEGIWSVVPTNIMVGNEKMRIWGVNGPGATNTINVLMNI